MVRPYHILLTCAVVVGIKFSPLLWSVPAAIACLFAWAYLPKLHAELARNQFTGWFYRPLQRNAGLVAATALRGTKTLVLPASAPRQRPLVRVERIQAARRAA